MRTMTRLLLWTLCIVSVAAGGWLGRGVPFSEQWPMFEALRTTASIIFAVIGAWLAIIYPERLKQTFQRHSGTTGPTAPTSQSGWTQLLTPVFHSTAILAVILILGVVCPLLKHNAPPLNQELMRGLSYGLLVTLTLWQVWTVVHTMVPADMVLTAETERLSKQTLAASFGTPAAAPPQSSGGTAP